MLTKICLKRATQWLAVTVCFAGAQQAFAATLFSQANLVSNVPGLAANTDPNLSNPWGVSFSPTSPFWVSNQVTGNSTLYGPTGNIVPLVVTTPPGGPTGQVFNATGQFQEANGNPAVFMFATLAGTIDAWNGANGTSAQVVATTANAAFTGLALANNGTANFLYAANAAGGRINVFDSSFNPVTLSGSFVDPNLPAGYTPFNVHAVNGSLYVEYSKGNTDGPGQGVVAEFDTNGRFIKELIGAGGILNSPWGIAIAPAGFGSFGGDLLVGNDGDGTINAFDPSTGAYIGTLKGENGQPVVLDGLWEIAFRNAPGYNPNSLYFAAGINGETDGLLGSLTPTPEPATFLFSALGLAAVAALKRARRKTA